MIVTFTVVGISVLALAHFLMHADQNSEQILPEIEEGLFNLCFADGLMDQCVEEGISTFGFCVCVCVSTSDQKVFLVVCGQRGFVD